MNELCISVRSLKRADYLKQCLSSLERNIDLEGVDFYFFQDGAINPFSRIRYATEEEIETSLKTFQESKLPNKVIYKSNINVGASIRNHYQFTTLFPRYEYVVLVDNDLIFNRYYIKTLKVLFRQFKNDANVGSLQTSFKHQRGKYQQKESAEKLERFVTYGFSHLWEMGLWREKWEKIKPYIEPYFKLTENCDFKKLLYDKSVYKDIREKLKNIYGSYHGITSEDYALMKAITMAGYTGIHTLTLRHKTVGEKGMYSFRGDRFKKDGFDCIGLYDVGNINEYELITIPGG